MTFAGAQWPLARGVVDAPPARRWGALIVCLGELRKMTRLVRVQAVLAVCLIAPFVVAGGVSVQGAVPSDTLFGQWVHQSGYALSMVVLGFCGQWALPAVVALVAGDVFSAEDHLGTWKMLLTRSRSRTEVFLGKSLAILVWTVAALVVLAAASVGAALALGAHPVVGLGGQLVPAGHAARLVAASWALQLPPMLGFAALALLLSIASRNSVVGIGVPVLLGLLLQVLSLVNLPPFVRIALLSTPFQSWHGLWVPHPFLGPVWHGLVTSSVWFAVCAVLSWAIFDRRAVRVSA